MTTDDSRPAPLSTDPRARQSPEPDSLTPPSGAALRLAEMRRDFSATTFAAILSAFHDDLTRVAEGLTTTTEEALARHGHVLTALAGELGETALSARGRRIELDRDPQYAAETAALITPVLALLKKGGEP